MLGMIQRCGICAQTGHKRTTCPTTGPSDATGLRRCSHCKEWKPEEAFSISNKRKGTRLRFCSVCMRPYRKSWYARHKNEQVERTSKTRQVRKAAARKLIRDLKSNPCADCGGRFHWTQMDFDHVKSDKLKDVARMVQTPYSVAKLLTEVAKCDLVCANCHRLRTWKRSGGSTLSPQL